MNTTQRELDRLSKELLVRLAKEEARPPTTLATERVGGLVKAAALLQQLLREVIIALGEAAENLQNVDDSTARRRGLTQLDRSETGELMLVLARLPAGVRSAAPTWLRGLVLDVQKERDSVVRRFAEARNRVAKAGANPALAREPARNLAALIGDLRRDAGWP